MRTGSILQLLPLFDPQGRFSALKSLTLVLLALPALWLAHGFTSGEWDFPSPYIPLIYHSGLWTAYLLLASLAITPLRKILRWSKLLQVRRMIGVASYFYLVVHLYAWIGLRYFNVETLLIEGLSRPSLWLATISLFIFTALTITSLDFAVQRMGGENWRRLHRLTYTATIAGLIHFLLSPGSIVGTPFLLPGIFLWLMVWRSLDKRDRGTSPFLLLVLTITTAVITVLLQLLWLSAFQTAPQPVEPWSTTFFALSPDTWEYLGFPPVLVVLILGGMASLCAAFRQKRMTRR
ncbi:ferric reductase-like transmembrane domain-containing protein [Devosia sp. WQ 349]|uniref:sulfite oxidase heme-binding subunit YedZ n=1 Tax=Devosia sp. WQ 349K1 TaxID=2800329 RepID=UPI001907F1E4|nr:ferric reductase-like transmembrane domain-containing protein [Devosia sp. WQ 349K1]MBK1796205.1 ferric reductase-like transmembrane domain-containing protein [Devosia sp. WQ 349K1]